MTNLVKQNDENNDGGHYATSGFVLMGLGAFALILAAALGLLFRLDLRFLDSRAMASIGLGFLAVGTWMSRRGHR